jgi:Tol biopolymer transport system component
MGELTKNLHPPDYRVTGGEVVQRKVSGAMHTNRIRTLALIGIIIAIGGSIGLAQKDYDLFQQALVKERAEGKPDEAITIYQRIIKDAGADPGLIAEALVRIAACYQKLGSPEASSVYQRVLREYADQPGAVAEARAALAGPAPRAGAPTSDSKQFAESKPRPLDLPGSAIPSPDGRYIAVATGDDLAVRRVSTAESRTLTHADKEEGIWGFTWSPDSSQLAYLWRRQLADKKEDFEVRLVNRDGSSLRTLLPRIDGSPTALAWSPDRRTIAVHVRQESEHDFKFVTVADGKVRELKASGTSVLTTMTFSRDGRYLVYDVPDPTTTAAIYQLDIRDGTVLPLIKDSSENRFAGWTPRGGLLFTSDRAGTWDLWLAHVTDGKMDGPPVKLKKDIGTLQPKAVSAIGAMYYSTGGLTSDAYMVSLDPATSKVIGPAVRVHQGIGHSGIPMWSPDGRQLAFPTGPLFQPWPTISIVSMETGEERHISPTLKGLAPNFTWSADAKYFFMTANPVAKANGGNWNLYRIDARTAEFTLIAPARFLEMIATRALPDGRSLTYVKNEARIVRRDLETGREEVVVDTGRGIKGNNPSPDGTSTAFVYLRNQESDKGDLRVASFGDSHSRTLVELTWDQVGFVGKGLCWSPDGRYILYFDRTSDKLVPGTTKRQSELWRIPVAGGPPERLGLTGNTMNNPAVSPDGRRLAFADFTDRNGYWVLDNFLPPSELQTTSRNLTDR